MEPLLDHEVTTLNKLTKQRIGLGDIIQKLIGKRYEFKGSSGTGSGNRTWEFSKLGLKPAPEDSVALEVFYNSGRQSTDHYTFYGYKIVFTFDLDDDCEVIFIVH